MRYEGVALVSVLAYVLLKFCCDAYMHQRSTELARCAHWGRVEGGAPGKVATAHLARLTRAPRRCRGVVCGCGRQTQARRAGGAV